MARRQQTIEGQRKAAERRDRPSARPSKNGGGAEPGKTEKKKETTMEFIASMAAVFVVGLFIITFNLQAFEIPSSSMENTLLIGDHVFVDRDTMGPPTKWIGPLIPYHTIHRGDIIVFFSLTQPGMFLVKRVIGVPGDHIHLQDAVVYLNGVKQNEPYVIHNGSYNPYRDNFPSVPPGDSNGATPEWAVQQSNYVQNGDIVVPPGNYFAMGDNRDVSFDSRYWGFVPRDHIVGRPMFIYWSFETPRDQYEKTSIGDRVAWAVNIVAHFFTRTEWRRMFHMVR